MRQVILLCGLLALIGCSKKAPAPAAPSAAKPSPEAPYASPVADLTARGNPDDGVVEVDGMKLTRGEVDAETEFNLQRLGDQIPPDQIPMARRSVRSRIIDQFIFRSLFRQEAERQGIQATPEDEQTALKEIAARLPPGLTVDAILKNSPKGEQAMRAELTADIKIKKLLQQLTTNVVEVTDQEVTDFMATYKNNLMMPETVTARHILIASAATDDEKTKGEKKKKAEDVRKKLLDGGDFAALAKEYSDDPGSKERGGNLGRPLTREQMGKPFADEAFADAAFAQETNAVGPIVETTFGYHIIQVIEHNQAGTAPRERIVDYLKGQKKEKAFRSYSEGLKAKAKIKYSDDIAPEAPPEGIVTAPVAAPRSR